MSMILCPECKNSISEDASKCPKCGKTLTTEDIEKGKRLQKNLTLITGLVLASIAIAILIAIVSAYAKDRKYKESTSYKTNHPESNDSHLES